MLKITLFARSEELCAQWAGDFRGCEDVTVERVEFGELAAHDAVVSPANSFGVMDGGFDAVLKAYFGDIQTRVQAEIAQKYHGIQPVGTSLVVETGNGKFPYLVHAPTMTRPSDISQTLNVFLAFRSILRVCSQHEKITSLACTGLGHGTGKMKKEAVSKQMKQAYDMYVY